MAMDSALPLAQRLVSRVAAGPADPADSHRRPGWGGAGALSDLSAHARASAAAPFSPAALRHWQPLALRPFLSAALKDSI